MKNRVIAGDFQGWDVVKSSNLFGKPKFYLISAFKREEFSKATVARYDIVDKNNVSSFGRAFIYGAVAKTLFGSLGILATSKNKQAYVISIELLNGKKALLEVDEKMYREILRILY